MQNLLTAQGYPKNIIGFLNLFEADSIRTFMSRYGNDQVNVDESFNDATMSLKANSMLSTVRNIDFGLFDKVFKNSSKGGYIRCLLNLPRYDCDISGEKLVDIGKFTGSILSCS